MTHKTPLFLAFILAASVLAAEDPGAAKAGWLGLRIADGKDGTVRVISVCPDGPSQKAGLRPGDTIVSFNGQPVSAAKNLAEAIRGTAQGSTVAIEMERNGERKQVNATVTAPPQTQSCPLLPNINVPAFSSHIHPQKVRAAYLGVMVQELTPELRKHFGAREDAGVLVARVDPKGPAAGVLEPGDVLLAVNGRDITCGSDLVEALRGHRSGDQVSFDVIRSGQPASRSVTVAEREKYQFQLDSFFAGEGHTCPADGKECKYLWHWSEEDFNSSLQKFQQMMESGEFARKFQEQSLQKQALEQKLRMLEQKLRDLEQQMEKQSSRPL